MTAERIIEVEVTKEHIEKLRADGVPENELPEPGIKRYRPARHVLKDKAKITLLLDAEILEHFEKRAEKENAAACPTQINDALRSVMERERAEEVKDKEKLAA